MNKESDLVANILLNDINTLIEDLNNVIKAHNVLVDRWNELKKWLEDNWQQSQDIWFVKIINKMQELEKESDVK